MRADRRGQKSTTQTKRTKKAKRTKRTTIWMKWTTTWTKWISELKAGSRYALDSVRLEIPQAFVSRSCSAELSNDPNITSGIDGKRHCECKIYVDAIATSTCDSTMDHQQKRNKIPPQQKEK